MHRVVAIWLAVAAAACGGKKSSTTPGGGDQADAGPRPPVARTLLGWGLRGYDPAAASPTTELFLEVTDHNGATRSYPLGEAAGACQPAPGNGDDIITSLRCVQVVPGAELRAVFRGVDIIVLRRKVDPADDPADLELSFVEVTRVPVPVGSKVEPAR